MDTEREKKLKGKILRQREAMNALIKKTELQIKIAKQSEKHAWSEYQIANSKVTELILTERKFDTTIQEAINALQKVK